MADIATIPFRDDIVALFPGQGSISSGAGSAWQSSRYWGLVDQVGEIAGVNVEQLLLAADTDEVVRTDNAQLATFALSLVGYHELLDLGVRPRYLLGHSLGEFTALVASGLLDLAEGTKLIAVRGAAMARAADASEGSMVAVMGGDDGARDNLSSVAEVWIANINGTGQIVLSGTRAGLDDLLSRHRDLGLAPRDIPRGGWRVSLPADGAGPSRTRRTTRRGHLGRDRRDCDLQRGRSGPPRARGVARPHASPTHLTR